MKKSKIIMPRIVPERTGGTTGSTCAKSSSSNNNKNKNRTEMLKYCHNNNNNNNNIKMNTKKQIEGGNQSLVTRSTMLVGIFVLVVVLIMILMIPLHPALPPPPPKIMSTILFYYSLLLSTSTGNTNTSTRIYNINTRTRSDDKSILSSSSSSTKISSKQQPEGSIKIWPRVQDIQTIRKNDTNNTKNDIDNDNATTTTTIAITTTDTNNETTYQIYLEDIIFQYYLVKQQQQRQQPSEDDTNNTNTNNSSTEDTNTNTNNNMHSEYEPIIIPTTTKTTSDTNFVRTILEQAEQRFRLALQHLTTPEYDVRTNYSSDLIDSNTGRKSDRNSCNSNINNNDNKKKNNNNVTTTTTRSATSLYPLLRYIRIYIRTNDTILDSTTDESYNISIVAPSTTPTTAAGSRNGLQQQQKEQEPISSMTMLLLNPTDNITTQIERKLSIQQENNTTIDDENVNDNSNNDDEPAIEIYATNVYGVLHAVQTIRQLVELGGYCNCTDNAWYEYATGSTSTKTTTTTTSKQTPKKTSSSSSSSNCNASSSIGSDIYYYIRDIPIHIIDYPRYSYRGLLIDTARHYLPLSLIHTNLNIMEMNKMNILHWHITDTQSFPYQSKIYPELSYNGSYCPTCIYTYDDVQSIMYEGQIRGIRVILEYDLPGHSEAIGKSHPEFLTNCSSIISEPLDVTKESVYTFVNNLYDEIGSLYNIQNLTKSSTADLRYGNHHNVQQQQQYWVHIGGDEVDIDSWKDSESIRQYMEQHNVSDVRELLYQFENRLLQKVQQMNFRPIVWQELYDSGTPLPLNTIIDVWKLSDYNTTSYNATVDGYDIIFSNCWYLDHLNMDWTGLYNCNPMQYIEANTSSSSSEQAKHILGGHASMWGERIDSSNLLPTVWPRASAVAEILWSGHPNRTTDATSESSTVHSIHEDIEITEQRLIRFRCLIMRQLQVLISPIAPGTCIDIV